MTRSLRIASILVALTGCSPQATPVASRVSGSPSQQLDCDVQQGAERRDAEVALAADAPNGPDLPLEGDAVFAPWPVGTVLCLRSSASGRPAAVRVIAQPETESADVLVGRTVARRLGLADRASLPVRVSVIRPAPPQP